MIGDGLEDRDLRLHLLAPLTCVCSARITRMAEKAFVHLTSTIELFDLPEANEISGLAQIGIMHLTLTFFPTKLRRGDMFANSATFFRTETGRNMTHSASDDDQIGKAVRLANRAAEEYFRDA